MRPGLGRHILLRLLSGVFVLWGAATLCFLTVSLRGDTVGAILGPGQPPTPELRRQIIAEYGLDDPWLVQYGRRLRELLTGDLGWSYQRDQPVARLLADQIGPTLQLAVAAALLSVLLAVAATLLTAGRGRLVRAAVSGLELLAVSLPNFWVGTVLLALFSFTFPIFPAVGAPGPAGLVLPAFALALPAAGVLAQVMRQELETAETRPFAVSVLARGAGLFHLRARHTLRHAALPVVTLSGWVLGSLAGGAVLIENIFARPGLGRLLASAAASRDLPVVTAIVLLSAAAFVVINLVVDLLYPLIDPRLRAEAAR
ncbi:peptide/nickel transport system permease protein [Sinosporangium album]|uniref:Peptide/nickel transport system permease protein n=1 Tax=Sinosporangium album TaxID=504805 RepID=A0A1G7YEG1_9ACTN|nr:ABC transporter permease [Sinosporangium album]SDG94871.1 peptide/nickel transport system permease protein [Sinosporangium album]